MSTTPRWVRRSGNFEFWPFRSHTYTRCVNFINFRQLNQQPVIFLNKGDDGILFSERRNTLFCTGMPGEGNKLSRLRISNEKEFVTYIWFFKLIYRTLYFIRLSLWWNEVPYCLHSSTGYLLNYSKKAWQLVSVSSIMSYIVYLLHYRTYWMIMIPAAKPFWVIRAHNITQL